LKIVTSLRNADTAQSGAKGGEPADYGSLFERTDDQHDEQSRHEQLGHPCS